MVNKVWQIAERKYDDLVAQLLYNRGVKSENEKAFFKPDFTKDLGDPFLLKNLDKALKKIEATINGNQKIGVFADYDADGIPGAALFSRGLKQLNVDHTVYIPSREEGYGLSRAGLDYLKNNGCELVITIDLGIRSFAEAEYAKKIGIDLIITDHHLPDEKIPKAFAVVNPKQKGDKYLEKELCGCAVAYKIIQALGKIYPNQIDEKFLKWNLDLVAISTISDVVPLSGENRTLAQFGLLVIKKTKNLGLEKLIKITGIDQEKLSAYHLGFQIGPRINAPGRMGQATKSFELLVTEDKLEADNLASWLNSENESRQLAMDQVEKEAIEQIEKNYLLKNKIIVVCGNWPKGVIGPTASRLVEKYHHPIIIFSEEKDLYVGSARSVSGVNIVDLLSKVRSLIDKFGGHAGAAGISLKKSNYKNFYEKIIQISDVEIKDTDLIKKIKVDAQVKLTEISKSLYEKISAFEPFGMANSRPTFMVENIIFDDFRFVGKDQNHLQGHVFDKTGRLKLIHFSFPYEKSMIKLDTEYDLVFSVNLDEWNGKSEMSLNIIDVRTSQNG